MHFLQNNINSDPSPHHFLAYPKNLQQMLTVLCEIYFYDYNLSDRMKLVAKYRCPHMINSTKSIKFASDMSKWVNPRWPTTWLRKSISGYNFCSRPETWMKIVAKYRFLSMRTSNRHMEMTPHMSKWLKIQDGYH